MSFLMLLGQIDLGEQISDQGKNFDQDFASQTNCFLGYCRFKNHYYHDYRDKAA
jgi:hypothetical protein